MIGLASELVTTGPEYVGLATYLLGRVLVVDHIDNAIAIARKYRHSLRMVTVEGESFSRAVLCQAVLLRITAIFLAAAVRSKNWNPV